MPIVLLIPAYPLYVIGMALTASALVRVATWKEIHDIKVSMAPKQAPAAE